MFEIVKFTDKVCDAQDPHQAEPNHNQWSSASHSGPAVISNQFPISVILVVWIMEQIANTQVGTNQTNYSIIMVRSLLLISRLGTCGNCIIVMLLVTDDLDGSVSMMSLHESRGRLHNPYQGNYR